MKDERQAFSHRLGEAMRRAGYEPRPNVLMKVFNLRYAGASVSEMSASRWLNGGAIPNQDKMQVLAELFGVEPQLLRFGDSKPKVGEARARWPEQVGAQERAMFDAFFALPPAQRRLVRELVLALAAQGSKRR